MSKLFSKVYCILGITLKYATNSLKLLYFFYKFNDIILGFKIWRIFKKKMYLKINFEMHQYTFSSLFHKN